MSKPISSAPVKIWPISWNGCSIRRTPPRSQVQLATRELPTELGIHQRHHVDPSDEEAAEEQVMAVDVQSAHLDAAHRHRADIAESRSGALEAPLDEGRAFELLWAGMGRHRPGEALTGSEAIRVRGSEGVDVCASGAGSGSKRAVKNRSDGGS